MERIVYTMRKPTEAERRIWSTADYIIEPVPRSCMPPPDAGRDLARGPGQPVTYHPGPVYERRDDWRNAFGAPIPAQPIPARPDPDKIVGVIVADLPAPVPSLELHERNMQALGFGPPEDRHRLDVCSCGRARGSEVHAAGAINGHPFEARGEPELPPIPEPGFYWAKVDGDPGWSVVDVSEAERVYVAGVESPVDVAEWGPKLEPPGSATAAPRLTYTETQLLRGALGAALLPAPFGFEPEVSRKLTGKEHDELVAAVARVALQPTECTHEAWEWPMQRCPGCGTDDVRKPTP